MITYMIRLTLGRLRGFTGRLLWFAAARILFQRRAGYPTPATRIPLAIALFALLAPISSIAEDWYFRPMHTGPYGVSDGTNYDNAWSRNYDIKWSEMQEGDTLYVLGQHFGNYGDVGWGNCTAAGITISGSHPDYPSESGVLTNAFSVIAGQDFVPSEAYPGTYVHDMASLYHGLVYDLENGYSPVLRVNDPAELTPGTFYIDSEIGKGYWKPVEPIMDSARFLLMKGSSPSFIDAASVTVRDLTFIGSGSTDFAHAVHLKATATYAKIEDNTFRFCQSAIGAGANANPAPDNVIVDGNTARNGKIFLFLDTNDDAFTGWVVRNNQVKDMTQAGLVGNKDNEVFYIQGLQDSLIKENVIDGYLGGAIDFYAISTEDGGISISGNVVERNVIKNGKYMGYGRQLTGLLVSGHNWNWDQNRIDPFVNNVFRYNLIHDLDAKNETLTYRAAIRIKSKAPVHSDKASWYIYNNTVSDIRGGMYAVEVNEGMEGVSDLYLVNNIFSRTSAGFQHGLVGDPNYWIIDHNIWHDIEQPNSFMLRVGGPITTSEHAAWVLGLRANGADGALQGEPEANSSTESPWMEGQEVDDFRLRTGSPAIDGGLDLVGMHAGAKDLAGMQIPFHDATDIGSYEYSEIVPPRALKIRDTER